MESPVTLEIPLDQLLPDPENRHYGGFNQAKLEELAASMKSVGCLEPALVRLSPIGRQPSDAQVYEIAAGERRWRAAALAGLATLPCIVRELSDVQLLEIRSIENVQREDVHPLDEAHGYSRLMNTAQWSVKTIAEKVGKSIGYVYASLKLLELAPEAREQLAEGKITAGHAVLIARLQPDDQRAVLKLIKDRRHLYGDEDDHVMSVQDLETTIHRDYFRELDRAAFRKDDAALVPEAGACTTCLKHTAAQPGLFADVSKKDCCLDPRCYNAKLDALVQRRKAELEGEKYVLAEGEYDGRRHNSLVPGYEWQEAKKKEAGAQRVLIASGPDRGRMTWGKVRKPARSGDSPKEKERQQREAARERRKEQLEQLTKRKLFGQVAAAEAKARTKNKKLALDVLRFAVKELFDQVCEYGDLDDDLFAVFWGSAEFADPLKAEKLIAKMDEPACLNLVLRCVLAQFLDRYRGDKQLIEAAKLLRVDVKAVEREASEELKRQEKEAVERKKAEERAAKEPKDQAKLELSTAKKPRRTALQSQDDPPAKKRTKHGVCSVCGCTEEDCTQCIEKTGAACHWVNPEHTLCSACAPDGEVPEGEKTAHQALEEQGADGPEDGLMEDLDEEDLDSELDADEDPGD